MTRRYTYIGNIGAISVEEVPTPTPSRTWRSGPTVNNRPAAPSFATDDVDELMSWLQSQGIAHLAPDLRQRVLNAAPAGPDGLVEID